MSKKLYLVTILAVAITVNHCRDEDDSDDSDDANESVISPGSSDDDSSVTIIASPETDTSLTLDNSKVTVESGTFTIPVSITLFPARTFVVPNGVLQRGEALGLVIRDQSGNIIEGKPLKTISISFDSSEVQNVNRLAVLVVAETSSSGEEKYIILNDQLTIQTSSGGPTNVSFSTAEVNASFILVELVTEGTIPAGYEPYESDEPADTGSDPVAQEETTANDPPYIVGIISGMAPGTYFTSDVIDIDVIFSEGITLTGVTSTLSLDSGGTAAFYGVTNSSTLTYRYTVGGTENSPDLDVMAFNLNSDTILDAAGDGTDTFLPGSTNLIDNNDIIIDTNIPFIVSVSSGKPPGFYTVGEVIDIDVVFSEDVTLTGTASTLSLDSGGTTTFEAVSNSTTLRYRYTVGGGENSSDLDVTAFNINTDTIEDVNFNGADVTLPAGNNLADNNNITIDTMNPSINSVTSTSPGDGTYGISEVITISVTYDENVTVNTTGGTPTVLLETGGTDRTAIYTGGSGTATLAFDYTVQAGDASTDLDVHDSLNQIALNGSAIEDSGFNAANLDAPTGGEGGSLFGNQDIIIDTTTASVVSVTSPSGDGYYIIGQVITINVTYDATLTVDTTSGTPTVLLETGTTDRTAIYTGGSGTANLTFDYTVQAGDTSTDLDVHDSADQITLNGGTMGGANRDVPTVAEGGSLLGNQSIVIDTYSPSITSLTSTVPGDGSYGSPQVITINVAYDENVTVDLTGGTPTLLLETGGTDRSAAYTGGSGTASLTFDYTVQAGDTSTDLDAHDSANQTSLNGSTMKDSATNNASLDAPTGGEGGSLSGNQAITILP